MSDLGFALHEWDNQRSGLGRSTHKNFGNFPIIPTFITPLLLAGSLLVAIPIVLHLAMRERPRKLEFPALRFLQIRRESNRRRLKIRHLFLLLLRCLVILLLAFAVARPVFHSSGFFSAGSAPVAAAIAFDTRPRMEYLRKNKTRLEVARGVGLEVIEQLPKGSQLVVLDSTGPRSQFDRDRGASIDRIAQLAEADGSADLDTLVENAIALLEKSSEPRKELYLLTDMGAVDWDSQVSESSWKRRLEKYPDIHFSLLDVGVENPINASLGNLRIGRTVVSEKDLIRIRTELQCLGFSGRQLAEIFVIDQTGAAEKKGEKWLDSQQGEILPLAFQIRAGDQGILQGYIELSRQDDLPIDNRRYFTISVRDPYQILIVAPDPAERQSRTLATAIAPPTLSQQGEARYELETVSYAELTNVDLDGLDAVWLLDPPPLSAEQWNQLLTMVDAGGGLAIALGSNAGMTPEVFNATASSEIMPAALLRQWRGDLYLAPSRLEHPLLQRFKTREGSIPWRENPIFKIWEIGSLTEESRVIIPYSNGKPALVARDLGRGRVLLLTTSLSPGTGKPWNELLAPREMAWPGFVLVGMMAEYLVGSAGTQLNYSTGELVRLPLYAEDRNIDSYLLQSPTGSRRIAPDDQGQQILISSTEIPGNYRIGAGGKEGTEYGFSANLPVEQTDLTRADRMDWAQRYPKDRLPIHTLTDSLNRLREDAEAKTKWEAAPWLLLALSIVFATEGLLATFFYQRPKI
ncbi:MAG: BatA domain-containing protein [Pirellulales bacterium]|nr:BatA domain-containing protein [Pirellulales bacterium]